MADGNVRGALTMLRQLAPSDSAARRELAETYRRMGNPDQSGRWGILIPGWTVEREQDRLARLLAASGVREKELPAFLSVPAGTELPREVVELYDGKVGAYRERFRARFVDRSRVVVAPGARVESAADTGLMIVAVLGIALVLTGFVRALIDLGDSTSFARASAVVMLAGAGLLALVRAIGGVMRRRARAASVTAALGLILLAGAYWLARTVTG